MPEAVRVALIAFGLTFVAVGGYYRIRSEQSGERLDRTTEGWPILIAIRLLGFLTLGSTRAWLWNPALFEMGFVADTGVGSLDWPGRFRLRCRLADVDVPRPRGGTLPIPW